MVKTYSVESFKMMLSHRCFSFGVGPISPAVLLWNDTGAQSNICILLVCSRMHTVIRSTIESVKYVGKGIQLYNCLDYIVRYY